MQQISFEATIKDGYIKIPEKYSDLNNENVVVEITSNSVNEKPDREKILEEFLRKYTGMLKNTKIPMDVTIKEIREMRLKEKIDLIITRNKKDFENEGIEVQTPEEYLASISYELPGDSPDLENI